MSLLRPRVTVRSDFNYFATLSYDLEKRYHISDFSPLVKIRGETGEMS